MYNILAVDDDKEIVKAIEIYLGKENYQIYKAYDGEQALKQIKNNQIHLVILDIMMPNKDGLETLEEIRKDKNIPVIMLSAKSEDIDKMIKISVKVARSQTKSEVPKHLLETYNYISQSDKVSNSVKQEFFNALRNKQVFNNGGNSSHSNFNHMQQMFAENERLNQELIQQEIWQQEELNRQNEQFNQMNQNNTMDNMNMF